MRVNTLSRRALLTAGAGTWFGTSVFQDAQSANATSCSHEESNPTNEQLIRAFYSAWNKKDWSAMDRVLADSFTFSSANDDDHINKATYKGRCWDGQVELVERMNLESVLTNTHAPEGFAKYLCRTTKGTAFRNVDYFRFADGKIAAIEDYFGGRLGFASAAAAAGK
jgi:ketosteroid isomerase-like protein